MALSGVNMPLTVYDFKINSPYKYPTLYLPMNLQVGPFGGSGFWFKSSSIETLPSSQASCASVPPVSAPGWGDNARGQAMS